MGCSARDGFNQRKYFSIKNRKEREKKKRIFFSMTFRVMVQKQSGSSSSVRGFESGSCNTKVVGRRGKRRNLFSGRTQAKE